MDETRFDVTVPAERAEKIQEVATRMGLTPEEWIEKVLNGAFEKKDQ